MNLFKPLARKNNYQRNIGVKLPFQEPKLSPGLFWLLEQIPGYFRREDLTHVLQTKTFWPSYNSPYFTDVFNMSGNAELVEKLGDWFSYDKVIKIS